MMSAVGRTRPFPPNVAALNNAVAIILHDSQPVGSVWFRLNWERQRVSGHLWWARFTEQRVALHYAALYGDRPQDDSNSVPFPLTDCLAHKVLAGEWSEREWIVLGANSSDADTSREMSLTLEFLSNQAAQGERRRIGAAFGGWVTDARH